MHRYVNYLQMLYNCPSMTRVYIYSICGVYRMNQLLTKSKVGGVHHILDSKWPNKKRNAQVMVKETFFKILVPPLTHSSW